jgi:hypothetical protein
MPCPLIAVIRSRLAISVGALLCSVSTATAQPQPPPDQEDSHEQERFVWHPTAGITGFGYDSNVFNLPSDQPGSRQTGDWVASLAAGLAPIWNVGDVRIAADSDVVYNYFRTFATERGVDATASGRIDIPIARVRFHLGGGYANLRQRVNYEIDQRARRTEDDLNGGFDVALGGRTTIDLGVRRGVVRFADDDPLTQTLRETLNRREQAATASVRYAMTPFTSLVVTGDRGMHRFDLSPGRNGNSSGLSGGLMLDSEAVIAGQALVGWRRITVNNPLIPTFSGLAWSGDLSTVLGTSTRLGAGSRRDVAFSSDELSPYYVQTSVGVGLTQALGDGWQIGAHADRVWLRYAHATVEIVPAYVEKVNVIGGQFGYRFPGGFRLGLEVESQQRRASTGAPGRAYRTLRTATVITKSIGS